MKKKEKNSMKEQEKFKKHERCFGFEGVEAHLRI